MTMIMRVRIVKVTSLGLHERQRPTAESGQGSLGPGGVDGAVYRHPSHATRRLAHPRQE